MANTRHPGIQGWFRVESAGWRDLLLARAAENPNLQDIDHDYKETNPQLRVIIDPDRAGDLGVSIEAISRTLESKLGSRRVTTFIEGGEEHDVLVEGEDEMYRSPSLSVGSFQCGHGAGKRGQVDYFTDEGHRFANPVTATPAEVRAPANRGDERRWRLVALNV